MPYEPRMNPSKRIAVIGGGISGMAAAHYLADRHNIVLFEDADRLGGHARTVVAGKRGDQAVDTGFIVFNKVNYPRLTALFEALDVPVAKSDMSFGASIDGGRIEYGLKGARAVMAQPRNLTRPGYYRLMRDVLHFNKHGLAAANDPGITIGTMLDRLGTGDWFRDYYILPLSGAIWSTPTEKILDFPAEAMVRFFKNHALMGITGRHQWFTVEGGAVEYVTRLGRSLFRRGVEVRLGAGVRGVRRTETGVAVRAEGGEWEPFDEVIFATHSDDTLSLLADANGVERTALGAIRYQANRAVLHADARHMPRRKVCWSSWNYTGSAGRPNDAIALTYWMNCLQPIPQDDPMFVTLNATQPIDESLIYDETTFRHPVYDLGALAAQDTLRAINGTNRTWFCGAWMRNGFHEDGIASAADVVDAMLAEEMAAVAAQ